MLFDEVDHFSEGLALVKVGNRYGFIDRDGKMVINPQFSAARGFSEALAPVMISEGSNSIYGFVNKRGKLVFTLKPEEPNKKE